MDACVHLYVVGIPLSLLTRGRATASGKLNLMQFYRPTRFGKGG